MCDESTQQIHKPGRWAVKTDRQTHTHTRTHTLSTQSTGNHSNKFTDNSSEAGRD